MIRQTKDTAFSRSQIIEVAFVAILGLIIAGYGAVQVAHAFKASVDHTVAALDAPK